MAKQHTALATAHAAKFSAAIELALKGENGYNFNAIVPDEFIGLEKKESRVIHVPGDAGWKV